MAVQESRIRRSNGRAASSCAPSRTARSRESQQSCHELVVGEVGIVQCLGSTFRLRRPRRASAGRDYGSPRERCRGRTLCSRRPSQPGAGRRGARRAPIPSSDTSALTIRTVADQARLVVQIVDDVLEHGRAAEHAACSAADPGEIWVVSGGLVEAGEVTSRRRMWRAISASGRRRRVPTRPAITATSAKPGRAARCGSCPPPRQQRRLERAGFLVQHLRQPGRRGRAGDGTQASPAGSPPLPSAPVPPTTTASPQSRTSRPDTFRTPRTSVDAPAWFLPPARDPTPPSGTCSRSHPEIGPGTSWSPALGKHVGPVDPGRREGRLRIALIGSSRSPRGGRLTGDARRAPGAADLVVGSPASSRACSRCL